MKIKDEDMTEMKCSKEDQANRDMEIRLLKRQILRNYGEICLRVFRTIEERGWAYAYNSVEEWAHQEHSISRRKVYYMYAVGKVWEKITSIAPEILHSITNADTHKLEIMASKISDANNEDEVKTMLADIQTQSFRDLRKKYFHEPLAFEITAYIQSISRPGKTITLKNVEWEYDASPDAIYNAVKGKKLRIRFREDEQ